MHVVKTFMRSFLVALAVSTATSAVAHTNEYLDTLDGEHGGQLRMSGAYHFELVAKAGDLAVYVTDHAWQPVEIAGASANAMVITQGEKTVIELQIVGPSMLRGHGDFMLDQTTTVHLKFAMPSGDAELATFQPMHKRPAKKTPQKGGHENHH